MTSDPTKCTVLYKILTSDEHAGLPTQGWTGTALDVSGCLLGLPCALFRSPPTDFSANGQVKDGFIHLSTSAQVPLTLERFFNRDFFPGDQLVLGAIPRERIDVEGKLKFDESAHGDRFGHIYGVSGQRVRLCPFDELW
jgi:hypothetical protein